MKNSPASSGLSPALPEEDPTLSSSTNPLNETTGILNTVLSTRTARGSYAQDAIFNRYLVRQDILVASFTFRGERIPLSWSLSSRSCNDMLAQLPAEGLTIKERDRLKGADAVLRNLVEKNEFVATKILDHLYGPQMPDR